MHSQLIAQLETHARRRPDDAAVRELAEGQAGRSLSWAGWLSASAALAERLRRIVPEDGVVLIGLDTTAAFHVAFVAGLLADRRVLPFPPESSRREIEAAVEATGPAVVIGEPGVCEAVDRPGVQRLGRRDVPLEAPSEAVAVRRALDRHAGRGAMLLNSPGVGDRPGFVLRSMASLDAVAGNCARAIGLHEDDRVLVPIPVQRSYGVEHGLLGPLMAGCGVELLSGFDSGAIACRLQEERITVLPGVPFIFEALAELMKSTPQTWEGLALRRAYSAGSYLPAGVAEAAQRLLGVNIGQVYGTTEVGSVTYNDPDASGFDPVSVGRPMPGVELRILDPDHPRIEEPLPDGVPGHIAVRAPSMFDHYVGEGVSSSSLTGGFFLTGDLGRFSEAGGLRITGRLKLLIDIGGLKVNPLEVETVLARHPDVDDAAVVPLPMTQTITRLKAIVVPRGDRFDAERVRRFAREQLSPHKVPRVIECQPRLPRTPAGGVSREALQC